MKINVTEVHLDEYRGVYHELISSSRDDQFKRDLERYNIDTEMLESIIKNKIVGWVDGVSRSNTPVKRLFSLIP